MNTDNQNIQQKIAYVGVNVSAFTELCEDALSTGADRATYAEQLAQFPDKERVVVLRNADAKDIYDTLESWYNLLSDLVVRETGVENHFITVGNDGGNSALSDLVALDVDQNIIMEIEAKFGAWTNAAPGIERVGNIIGGDAFAVDLDDRARMIQHFYAGDEDLSLQILMDAMTEYADNFNNNPSVVNSPLVHELLTTSGKQGNGELVSNYHMVSFLRSKATGEASIKQQHMNIAVDDTWNIEAVVSNENGTPRLSYYLRSPDGQRQVKMMHNNKNTLYVGVDGNFVQPIDKKKKDTVPDYFRMNSFYQAGQASYNVWYTDRNDRK